MTQELFNKTEMELTSIIPNVELKGNFLEKIRSVENEKPFSEYLINFVQNFSKRLLTHPSIRDYPELAVLGYRFRKSIVLKERENFFKNCDTHINRPVGLVFHVAPSNVDSVFLYSGLISFLLGNVNIIRISQNITPQTKLVISILRELMLCDDDLLNRMVICTYPHESKLSEYLSLNCDLRMVWGSDSTINKFKGIPTAPLGREVSFSNRFSFSVISTDSVLSATDGQIKELANDFYNDSMWFGQQACSSPRAIFWVGCDDWRKASKRFWKEFKAILEIKEYAQTEGEAMDRFVASSLIVSQNKLALEEHHSVLPAVVKQIGRDFGEIDRKHHCGNGLFYEYAISEFSELKAKIHKEDQTISFWGFSNKEINDLVVILPTGFVDRIVPIGKSLDFSHIWDGIDLYDVMIKKTLVIR